MVVYLQYNNELFISCLLYTNQMKMVQYYKGVKSFRSVV